MIKLASKREDSRGCLWLTQFDSDDWQWVFMILPMLIHQDFGFRPGPYFQQDSGLSLSSLPVNLCKVPSTFFFPFVTYFTGNWFQHSPSFVIPSNSLNRRNGRKWLRNISPSALDIFQKMDVRLTRLDKDGNTLGDNIELRELANLVHSVDSYFLDEIGNIYSEPKKNRTERKSGEDTRFCFSDEVGELKHTKAYLEWYIDRLNEFFEKLLEIGKRGDMENRKNCLLSGLTINRLATDALVISSVDAPFVRKWQFLGFLDGLASIMNYIKLGKSNPKLDGEKVREILGKHFYENEIAPAIGDIPVIPLRDALTEHTKKIYESVMNIGSKVNGKVLSGPELIWRYRNSRHGFFLQDPDELLFHDGRIPNELPDLVIALWHYLILKFPF